MTIFFSLLLCAVGNVCAMNKTSAKWSKEKILRGNLVRSHAKGFFLASICGSFFKSSPATYKFTNQFDKLEKFQFDAGCGLVVS